MTPAGLGIRVKSGWASAVLLAADRQGPRLLLRRRLLLADPDVPQSAQPYHRGFGRLQQDAALLRRLTRIVHRASARSLSALMAEARGLGAAPAGLALVVGSTADPARITNEHIRAHAYEGRLFRAALEAAAGRLGLRCSVIRESELPGWVDRCLPAGAGAAVAGLRAVAGRPWRADEKHAALAAWIVATTR